MIKKVFILLIVCAGLTGGYWFITNQPDPSIKSLPTVTAKIGGTETITLYAPESDEGIQKGLSVFKSLPDDHGMIFRGLPVGTQVFWMKNMQFDIAIIWVDKDNRIVHIVHAASKDSYPLKFQNPQNTTSAYVIELNAGMCEKKGIVPGGLVEIQ